MGFTSFKSGISKSSNVTLSGSNLTMTLGSSVLGGATSLHCKSSGKFYVEFNCTTMASGGGVGILVNTNSAGQIESSPTAFGYGGLQGSAFGGAILYEASGAIKVNTTTETGTGTSLTGHVGCLAIDLDNKKFWARTDGGNWNGSGTANPATNTGGYDISGFVPGAGVYLCAFLATSGDNVTLNAGATSFAQTPPSGFTGWTDSSDPIITIDLGSETSVFAGGSSFSINASSNDVDRIMMLHVWSENIGTTLRAVSTVSGGSLTWTLHKAISFNGCSLEIWWAHAPTALSASAITVTLTGGADACSINMYAVSGANVSAPFDTNASIPGNASDTTGSSTTGQVTGLTTDSTTPLVVASWGNWSGGNDTAVNQEAGFAMPGQISHSHGDSNWGQHTTEAKSFSSALSSTTISTTPNHANWLMIATALQPPSPSLTGTWGSTEATDTMTATGMGQPVPPNVDATFGELTGHDHSIVSPASLSFSGTNKAAGGNEYFLALIGYNLRAGIDVTVSSVTVTGLTFVKLYSVNNPTSGASNNTIEVWGAPASSAFNSGGANLTYTITWGSGQEVDDAAVCVIGIQGLNSLTQPLDPNISLAASAHNSTSTTPAAVVFSTSLNHDLLIGLTINIAPFGTNEFPVAPSGWSQIASPNDNSGLAGIALGVNTKSVTSAQSSATFQDAATGSSVGWTELVFALTADPTPPPTGTMGPTEAKDIAAFSGYPELSGVWGSTEAKDVFSGLEARSLSVDTVATGGAGTSSSPPLTSATVTLTTNFPDEVMVLYSVSGGDSHAAPISGITDTAGSVWKRRNIRRVGGGAPYVELWWAPALSPVSGNIITVDYAAGTGAASLIAIGVTGADPTSPWDLHTFAGRAADNVGSGNPTAVFYTEATNSLMLALYASQGVDNAHTITSPFTDNADINQTEHAGFTMFASLASAVVSTPQSNLQIQYGNVGGGFNQRFLLQDALAAFGDPSTAQPVQFFLDPGGARTSLALTSTNQSVNLNTTGFYNQDLMYVAAILIETASGLGTVTSIADSESKFGSPGWERRARVTDPTGLVALETWYGYAINPPDGSDIFAIDTANTVAGDTLTCVMFAVGNTTAALAAGEPFWDGSGTLPALNDSNTGGGIGVYPHVTGMNTINPHTLLIGVTANLTTNEGPDATLPFFSDNPPVLSLTSAGPPANIAIEFMYQPTLLSAGMATFDASPSPPTWVMIGDAITVGLPVPPTGVWGSIEAPDKLTHTGNFAAIGVASPGGWFAYVPATAVMAATDAKDKPGGAPAQAPYNSIGWLGWVPAHATMAPTDRKDTFAGAAWVLGTGVITGRWGSHEAKDRMSASNIGPAVTASWHSTEAPDRLASVAFVIPKVPPPLPRRRRLLIIS